MSQGPRLYRYDVLSRQFETVFDASPQFGADKYLWQIHSSNDDRVHSATLRHSGTYEMLGCVAYREDTRQATFVPKRGDFDECQIDKSGRWLVIKENVDGHSGEDNRIVDLQTGAERVLLDQNGAAGHSDIGYGYMVAEDNWYSRPGAVRAWRFDLDLGTGDPQQGRLVYTSGTQAVAGLRVAACFWDLNATLTDVLIMSGASSPTLVPTSPAGGGEGTVQSRPALPRPSSIRRRGW